MYAIEIIKALNERSEFAHRIGSKTLPTVNPSVNFHPTLETKRIKAINKRRALIESARRYL